MPLHNSVMHIKNKMRFNTIDMTTNTIKAAKFKLLKHKSAGVESTLSVFEVARLMDKVRRGENVSEEERSQVFFSMN